MELSAMKKRNVWRAGSSVFLLLAICTALSTVIQRTMSISVWTTRGENQDMDGAKGLVLPVVCIQDSDMGPVVFWLEETEGIFGTEWRIAEEPVVILEENGGTVTVLGDLLQEKDIVYYASWPPEPGETVVRGE